MSQHPLIVERVTAVTNIYKLRFCSLSLSLEAIKEPVAVYFRIHVGIDGGDVIKSCIDAIIPRKRLPGKDRNRRARARVTRNDEQRNS